MRVLDAGLVNSGFTLAGSAANILLVPVLLQLYGLEVYGALCLLLALSQYFALLDLGFSNALVKYHVRILTHQDASYYRYRGLIVRLLLGAGALVICGAALAAPWWGPAFRLSGIEHLGLAVAGAGALTLCALVGNCYNTALVARLRYTHLSVYNLVRNLAPQLVIAGGYWWTGELAGSLAAAALFAVLLLQVQLRLLRRDEPALPEAPASGRRGWRGARAFLRESVSFSLVTVFNALSVPILQTVIGFRFGPEANGVVEIARRALFAFRGLIHAAFVPLFARANQLIQRGELEPLRRLLVGTTAACTLLAFGVYGALLLALPPILGVWIGEAALRVEPVADDLLLAVAFSIPHIALYNVLSTVHAGRLTNAVASASALVVTGLAILPWADEISDVLHAYAAGVALGALITLSYGAHFLRGLSESPSRVLDAVEGGDGRA